MTSINLLSPKSPIYKYASSAYFTISNPYIEIRVTKFCNSEYSLRKVKNEYFPGVMN